MAYKMKTNRGIIFTINTPNFDAKGYMSDLNNEKLLMVPLGSMLAQKHNIEWIAPEEALVNAELGFTVEMQSGDKLFTDIEEFNTVEAANVFNANSQSFVMLGEVIVNRRNVNMVIPQDAQPVVEEVEGNVE